MDHAPPSAALQPEPHTPPDLEQPPTMSSSQIPNLLSSRGGPRLRGRGRGRGGPATFSASSRRDQNVQSTDTDAAVSRLSAVSLGYLDDPFAQYFVHGNGIRRLPIINRGMYSPDPFLGLGSNMLSSLNWLTPQQGHIPEPLLSIPS
jgi:hypothetical protein